MSTYGGLLMCSWNLKPKEKWDHCYSFLNIEGSQFTVPTMLHHVIKYVGMQIWTADGGKCLAVLVDMRPIIGPAWVVQTILQNVNTERLFLRMENGTYLVFNELSIIADSPILLEYCWHFWYFTGLSILSKRKLGKKSKSG